MCMYMYVCVCLYLFYMWYGTATKCGWGWSELQIARHVQTILINAHHWLGVSFAVYVARLASFQLILEAASREKCWKCVQDCC